MAKIYLKRIKTHQNFCWDDNDEYCCFFKKSIQVNSRWNGNKCDHYCKSNMILRQIPEMEALKCQHQ